MRVRADKPIVPTGKATPLERAMQTEAARAAAPIKGRILVVDDEFGIREMMSKIGPIAGFEIVVADSCEQAEQLLARFGRTFDAVITDMRMEELKSGIVVLREAKRINPEVIVAVITGYGVQRIVADSLNAGADIYRDKPFDCGELFECIEAKIGERDQRRWEAAQRSSYPLSAAIEIVVRHLSNLESFMATLLDGLGRDRALPPEQVRSLRAMTERFHGGVEEFATVVDQIMTAMRQVRLFDVEPISPRELIEECLQVVAGSDKTKVIGLNEDLRHPSVDRKKAVEAVSCFLASAVRANAVAGRPEANVFIHVEDVGYGMKFEIIDTATRPEPLTSDMLADVPLARGRYDQIKEYLSLAIAYRYIKAHGGECQVYSEAMGGTCVSIEFPFTPPNML